MGWEVSLVERRGWILLGRGVIGLGDTTRGCVVRSFQVVPLRKRLLVDLLSAERWLVLSLRRLLHPVLASLGVVRLLLRYRLYPGLWPFLLLLVHVSSFRHIQSFGMSSRVRRHH